MRDAMRTVYHEPIYGHHAVRAAERPPMTEQQRAVAAVQGYLTAHVIVAPVEPGAGEVEHVLYTVRVSIKGEAPGVTITPEPPSAEERKRVLGEAHRLLERRSARATLGTDRQMLTQALIGVTREIDVLP